MYFTLHDRETSTDIVTSLPAGLLRKRSSICGRDKSFFLFYKASRLISCLSILLFHCYRQLFTQGVKLAIYLYLLTSLRIRGATLLLPFVSSCLAQEHSVLLAFNQSINTRNLKIFKNILIQLLNFEHLRPFCDETCTAI